MWAWVARRTARSSSSARPLSPSGACVVLPPSPSTDPSPSPQSYMYIHTWRMHGPPALSAPSTPLHNHHLPPRPQMPLNERHTDAPRLHLSHDAGAATYWPPWRKLLRPCPHPTTFYLTHPPARPPARRPAVIAFNLATRATVWEVQLPVATFVSMQASARCPPAHAAGQQEQRRGCVQGACGLAAASSLLMERPLDTSWHACMCMRMRPARAA